MVLRRDRHSARCIGGSLGRALSPLCSSISNRRHALAGAPPTRPAGL
jgi:hypothetical protein